MSNNLSSSSNPFESSSSANRPYTVDAVIKPAAPKLHPLMIAAAVSIMIASGVVVASYTGLLPSRQTALVETAGTGLHEQTGEAAKVVDAGAEPTTQPSTATSNLIPSNAAAPSGAQPALVPQASPAQPTASSAPQHSAPQHRQAARPRPAQVASAPAAASASPAGAMPELQAVPQPAPICRDCGVVTRVQTIEHPVSQGPGLGAIAGGLVGGLLGNQVGKGDGRKAMTVLGAAGGALAGNQIEKKTRVEHRDRVEVQFQDGTSQIFNFDNSPVRQGDRVRVVNGQLVLE